MSYMCNHASDMIHLLLQSCKACDELEVYGCTYPDAINYDSLATADDGSCLYDDVSSDCPADIDGDGTVTTQDLLSFLSFFGEICE